LLAWRVNPQDPQTEVEVRFTPENGRTRLELEHRGWERYGGAAEDAFGGYHSGWDVVLARYGEEIAP
jgi:hypothetical protein